MRVHCPAAASPRPGEATLDETQTSQPRRDHSQAPPGRRRARRGGPIAAICQKLGVAEATFHRWRNQYGGLKANEARRLKELERENARLKKLVAEQALDQAILKEALRGKY